MRKSTAFIAFIAACTLCIMALSLHALRGSAAGEQAHRCRLRLVKELTLTDLCLFTEARYTRNLSMADRHSPFQDHPTALEHFPTGAFTPPRP